MLGRGIGVNARSRRCVTITCGLDRYTHHVDDVMLVEGVARGSGRLTAICGRSIISAAMIDPPGAPCPLCAAVADMPVAGDAVPRPARRLR